MGNERVFQVTLDEGDYHLEAEGRLIGNDLLVAVWGGDKPHVGAVAIAEPRPSLKDPDKISATASVYALIGHKEDLPAKTMAERIAARFNRKVVITMGMHWDNLTPEGIATIEKMNSRLESLLCRKIDSLLPSPS